MVDIEKIVVITKKTALEELIERFNTLDQARFYIEHMGASFAEYQAAHDAYMQAMAVLTHALPRSPRHQFVDRTFLPTFLFGPADLVVTLGPDGLVANTAKYLTGQSLLALNPDPERIDGILLPYHVGQACEALQSAIRAKISCTPVTMAKATLNDGQVLYAINDLFIGARTHVSARYRISIGDQAEDHSSSGIIVSTGAGSTGWYRSIITGAAAIMADFTGNNRLLELNEDYRFNWDAEYLFFNVREPFISRTTSAGLVCGCIEAGHELTVISQMPQNGVIFSDGIEADHLPFNSGAIARIGLAEKRVQLITQI
jgi:NAD kinase